MSIRKRFLPPGWYPAGAERTTEVIQAMSAALAAGKGSAGSPGVARVALGVAGIVPHAGWEFSGSLALEVMSYLSRSIDTIVIIGGHLGPSDGIVCAMEDGYETPLGPMAADRELLGALGRAARLREDRSADNSVEVQLPFARYLFPHARVLCLRAAPSEDASALGKAIAAACRQLGRKAAVVGSTDLTHYGPAYGFSPAGSGEKALSWMRDVNDRRFIEALLQMDDTGALGLARTERSACSAGGALCAISFAREMGVRAGRLLRYATSYEVHPADSFVGYAGVLYSP
ncbi:MAG: AmmeMemoRadiSam system protein B [Spirochaetia bacterium]